MKLSIFLFIIAGIIVVSYFQPYMAGNYSQNVGGGMALGFIACPCIIVGVRRIKKQKRQQITKGLGK